MTTPALPFAAAPPILPAPAATDCAPVQDVRVAGVACLLLAIEDAVPDRIRCIPLARLGDDFVAATVMIDLGTGSMPFDLATVRLAAACLRADPLPGKAAVADALILAADQAQAAAVALLPGLN